MVGRWFRHRRIPPWSGLGGGGGPPGLPVRFRKQMQMQWQMRMQKQAPPIRGKHQAHHPHGAGGRPSEQGAAGPVRVELHDLLGGGPLAYPRAWAYQQVLLGHRLWSKRRAAQAPPTEEGAPPDCLLVLEHAPVYTLGRGASEEHLAFLDGPGSASACASGLARTARGPGTARLSLDRSGGERLERALAKAEAEEGGPPEAALEAVGEWTASIEPVLAPNGVPVYRVERGGEVTFHGPSQLVVYPMLDLKRPGAPYEADLHWYLKGIEEVVLSTLAHYGIEGDRDASHPGVWVGSDKIAAVGISASGWITTHGFALNVDPDLSPFDTSVILPCGIPDRGVTSMGEVLRRRNRDNDRDNDKHKHKDNDDPAKVEVPSLSEVAEVVRKSMEEVFGVVIR